MAMVVPFTTATFAGVFALIYVALTVWIMVSRTTHNTLQGQGDATLARRIRVHANFGEYVPLALIVIGLYEGAGGRHGWVVTALWLLLIGRLLHPFGLYAPPNSPQMYACRGGGMLLTLLALVIGAVGVLE